MSLHAPLPAFHPLPRRRPGSSPIKKSTRQRALRYRAEIYKDWAPAFAGEACRGVKGNQQ